MLKMEAGQVERTSWSKRQKRLTALGIGRAYCQLTTSFLTSSCSSLRGKRDLQKSSKSSDSCTYFAVL